MTEGTIDDESELLDRVRAATGYEDSPEELPATQLSSIFDTAKLHVSLKTGADDFFNDDGLALVLFAYTCMRAKAAVENIPLSSYTLGDEQLSFESSDPDGSQQLQQWAEDVAVGMAALDSGTKDARVPTNTSQYVGNTFVEE